MNEQMGEWTKINEHGQILESIKKQMNESKHSNR